MLTIVHTKDGTLLDGIQFRGSITFDHRGLNYSDHRGIRTEIPWEKLLEIQISDLQGDPAMYRIEKKQSASWVTRLDNLITIQVKNKLVKRLLVWLFRDKSNHE